jgi:hypothetical protein
LITNNDNNKKGRALRRNLWGNGENNFEGREMG